jgi:NAD(P)H dehydrogenase (quinone)
MLWGQHTSEEREMIVVTAATGQLGQLVVDGLLEKVPASEIAVAVRNPAKAAGLAARGVQVRTADYDDAGAVAVALTGADKVLLISGNEHGKRAGQHIQVVEAAKRAGAGQIVYTSVLRAGTNSIALAAEHRASEQAIHDSGLPFTILRNGWYTENYAPTIQQAAETGSFVGSAGTGKLASAARADYAAAAVAAVTGDGHLNKVYELAGDLDWSYPELAAELTKATGREVVYQDLPAERYEEILLGAGLPAELATAIVGYDRGIAAGDLAGTGDGLSTLIGRPTTTLAEVIATILKS